MKFNEDKLREVLLDTFRTYTVELNEEDAMTESDVEWFTNTIIEDYKK